MTPLVILSTGTFGPKSEAPVSYKGGIMYNSKKMRDVEADRDGNAVRRKRYTAAAPAKGNLWNAPITAPTVCTS